MDIRRGLHKYKPRFDAGAERDRTAQTFHEKRQRRRTDAFNAHRNIEESSELQRKKVDPVNDRKKALKEYITRKEAVKKEIVKYKKPPFIVGIPHHGSSPVLKDITNYKAAENKATFEFTKKLVTSTKALTSPQTPEVLKRSARKLPPTSQHQNLRKCTPGRDAVVNKKARLNIHLAEKALQPRAILDPNNSPLDKAGTSSDIGVSALTSDPANDESQKQRDRVDVEAESLLSLANQWETVAVIQRLPTDVQDEIDSLVGQTRLLTRDKFNQHRRLIDDFEQQVGPRVTLEDLNGFWDMVYLQVEPLKKRYENLTVLKANNWVKPSPVVQKKKVMKKTVKSTSQASSFLKDMIKMKRSKAASSSTVVPEFSKTPVKMSSPALAYVLSNPRRTRSNPSSPYIAMSLSLVARSSGKLMESNGSDSLFNNTCSPSRTPTRKLKIKEEIQEEFEINVLPHADVPQEPMEVKQEATSYDETSKENEKVDYVKSPRRSARLQKMTPTPECSPCLASPIKENEKPKAVKKLVLKPSTLVVPDLPNLGAIPKTTNLRTKKSTHLKKSVEENVQDVCKRTRNVTFSADLQEKVSLKIPATPYRYSKSKDKLSSDEEI